MAPALPTRSLGKDGKYSSRRCYILISSCYTSLKPRNKLSGRKIQQAISSSFKVRLKM